MLAEKAHFQACSRTSLLLWDDDALPTEGDWTTVLWRSYGEDAVPEAVSIPRLVEEQADFIKARYLAWIYELGETRINGKRLVDHLQLRPGFSAWWMSLLTEKCNFAKSPQISDAIRLIAFENWVTGQSVGRIVLASTNKPLVECIRSWCANKGVAFDWQRVAVKAMPLPWSKRLYESMPHPLQALIWLVYRLSIRWPLRGVGLREWRETKGQMTFVSYLDNLVTDSVDNGRFESRYWAHLPDMLQHEGRQTNWLHLYVKDAFLPNAKSAADAVRRINETSQGKQVHTTLDAFLGVGAILGTLRDWFGLAMTGWRLQPDRCMPKIGELDLWPLFREDWRRSLFGMVAMSNVFSHYLLESALRALPEQRVGVYLQEKQDWEAAFIHAWKAAGHGRLIGMVHTPVKYWDLRSFYDPRCYVRNGGNDLPLPDHVALNGPEALAAYRKGGYPEDHLVGAEALRYLHLGQAELANGSMPSKICEPARLLVLGDYLPSNTRLQMKLLEQAVSLITRPLVITVKPHPNCPIQAGDYPTLNLQISMGPIAILLAECDMAYASAVTSAAVDAYCAGVPIVSVLNPSTLNLSPLRGCVGALFVSTPDELADALISAASSHSVNRNKPEYFTVDAQLPNWRRLLL